MSDTPASHPQQPAAPNPYTNAEPLSTEPVQANLAGSYAGPYQGAGQQGDGTGGLIPFKNPKALIAYYLGIFGLLPVVGLPMSIAAFVLGILGLKARKANPIVKGSVHAWIGIVFGAIATIYSTLIVVGVIVGLVANA